ncbi:hypothetical protein AALO_G00024350 [Alosa alosa]|uniref:C1q domain-containing protein n=1 Tax=Alosa alosa TaxID=278164 RepID=A0AAV6HA15_9TELE|nr:myosin-11-like [Alosa alosa]KAG5284228.1 hypothetical protein AALO_G00024350 [Alosa alosa]
MLGDLRVKLNQQEMQLESTRQQLGDLREFNAVMDVRLNTTEVQVMGLKEVSAAQGLEIGCAKARLDVSEKDMKEVKTQGEAQASKINALEDRSSSTESQVLGQQAEMGGMKDEIDDLKKEISGISGEGVVVDLKADIESLKNENAAQALELKALGDKSSSTGVQVEEQQAAVLELKATVEGLRGENAAQARELTALGEKSSATQSQVEVQTAAVVELQAEVEGLKVQTTAQALELDALSDMANSTGSQVAEQLITVAGLQVAVETLTSQSSALDAELEAIDMKATSVEMQVGEQQAAVVELKAKVEGLQTENAAQATELKTLGGQFTDHQGMLDTHALIMTGTYKAVEVLVNDVGALKEHVADLVDGSGGSSGGGAVVAFSAALGVSGRFGPYNSEHVIRFKNVITRVGEGYDPKTGIFTATINGVYYFSFTTAGVSDHYSRGVIFYKNTTQISHASERSRNDGYGHVTSSATLQLVKGDRVYLSLSRNFQLYDDTNNHNTFNGFLISSN